MSKRAFRYQNLLIGADPELFLQNPNDGGFVSAHPYIPGTKDKPFVVDKGAIQLDGTAVEFNILPASTSDEFVDNIRTVLGIIDRDYVVGTGYRMVAEPVADFDPVYFDQSVPDEAKRLGCDPDYDAWEFGPNDPPDGTRTFRTGAGHIHIGWGSGFDPWDADHYMECCQVARQLDYYLGIHSLLWDGDNRRRQLYGKAGAFRPKSYGVEYRVLSNAWLRTEPLQRWVYHATRKAMMDLDLGLLYEESYKDRAREIINNNITNWRDLSDAPKFIGLPTPPSAKKAA